ncbi:unnamed protein product [Soboliphyme baturini]|uniref:Type II toxin-antitoxin system PemK/MazF family toxin n=1 Tax=Soboliphyme baturini TaxID=241478 RepID=A0A183IAK5_9BILA|nr:unnamed protein product [Soboliphyme baturini]
MSRPLNWQTVCCCLDITDHKGTLTPTTLIVDPSGTKAVCVKFPIDTAVPQLYIQADRAADDDDSFVTGLMTSQKLQHIRGRFRQVDCERLCGMNFLHQLEMVLSLL